MWQTTTNADIRKCVAWAGTWLALTASAAFATPNSAVPPFEAKGIVSIERHGNSGAASRVGGSEADFIFWYSNGWWQIECTFRLPERSSGMTINCSRLPDGIRYRVIQNTDLHTTPTATAYAFLFPPPQMAELLVTWLALCPRPELPLIDNSRMRRLLEAEVVNHEKNVGQYSLGFLEPGPFLSKLYVTNNGFIFGPHQKVFRCPGPFADGYLESAFEVTETTNYMGAVLPLRATYSRFFPRPDGTRPRDIQVGSLARLDVASIGPLDVGALGLHAAPARLIALDKREPDLPPGISVNHVVTNDQWPLAKDRRMIALTAAYTGTARRPAPHRWIWLGCFAVLTALPVAALLLRRMSARRRTNQQR